MTIDLIVCMNNRWRYMTYTFITAEPVVPPSSPVSPDSSNEEVLKNLKSVYVESTTTHQTVSE